MVACDPGWYVTAQNGSDAELLVRVSMDSHVRVFQIPPHFDGIVDAGIGTQIRVTVDLLEPDCALKASGSATGRSAAIRILSDQQLIVEATAFPDQPPDVAAKELKGVCGSTRPLD
jgi:hypothetical protein